MIGSKSILISLLMTLYNDGICKGEGFGGWQCPDAEECKFGYIGSCSYEGCHIKDLIKALKE